MKINLYQLSKEQIFVLKGIAILLIAIHNYIHIQSGISENEIFFNINITKGFILSLQYPDKIFNSIMSYLGHYGVQLFIFCSGYGLTKKYIHTDKINYRKYIIPQVIKLYGLLITGLIFTVIIQYHDSSLRYSIGLIGRNLLMINTFSYETIFRYVGPFWFFGLILQLYLLYPFLLQIIKKYNTNSKFISVLAIVYLVISILFPICQGFNIPLFGNSIGHLPEFLLGIWLASNPKISLNGKILIGAVVVFIISNLSLYTFPFSFLSITVIMLFVFYSLLSLNKSSVVFKLLHFIGVISMFIFITNGGLRSFSLFIFDYSEESLPLYLTLTAFFHILIVIVVSYIISLIYKRTIQPWGNKLEKKLIK